MNSPTSDLISQLSSLHLDSTMSDKTTDNTVNKDNTSVVVSTSLFLHPNILKNYADLNTESTTTTPGPQECSLSRTAAGENFIFAAQWIAQKLQRNEQVTHRDKGMINQAISQVMQSQRLEREDVTLHEQAQTWGGQMHKRIQQRPWAGVGVGNNSQHVLVVRTRGLGLWGVVIQFALSRVWR
jgi:hypothetical protein